MTKQQLQLIQHLMWSLENLGKEATKVRKSVAADVASANVELVEITEPVSDEEGLDDLQAMHGDAGKANSKYFRVRWRRAKFETEIYITCPTLLRRTLTIYVRHEDGAVYGSY